MKTQLANTYQILSGINNIMIVGINNLKGFKLQLSPKKVGNYFLPLVKQLFKDNFMGSEMEMGMILLFVKSYFLVAAYAIRHNALTDRVKKLKDSTTRSIVLKQEDFYQHKQAA
ncbi:MAG: hypothetical protein ACXVB0_04840 [Mucilaginibacter sp.]